MNRLRNWAQAQLPPEGCIIEGRRAMLAVGVLRPGIFARMVSWRFRRAAALPGDRWCCVVMDKYGIVREVRRDGVLLAVASGYQLACSGAAWEFESAAPAVALELVPWDNWRWGPW